MKQDKAKHIVSGLLASAWCSLPVYHTTYDLFVGLWVCIWVGLIVAACKEWCDNDYSLAGYFDWRDFLLTVAGAVLIALLIVGMHFGRG